MMVASGDPASTRLSFARRTPSSAVRIHDGGHVDGLTFGHVIGAAIGAARGLICTQTIEKFDAFVDRELFRGGYDNDAGGLGLVKDVQHPCGLRPNQPGADEFVDGLGSPQQTVDMTSG
jgi:hypothetical protein